MERLTKRLDDGQPVMDCQLCDLRKHYGHCTALSCRNRLKDRLAAYEDTGLEPEEATGILNLVKFYQSKLSPVEAQEFGTFGAERLRELIKAEREGRLVVLPCKVGQTVWNTIWWDTVKEKCFDSKGNPFYRERMKSKITKAKYSPFGLDYTEFGKTVFLTPEAAAAALEVQK